MLRKALIGLGVLGLGDALYLTYVKLLAGGVCVAGDQCEIVNTSVYSTIGGIPISLFGAGTYAVMLVVLFLETRQEFLGENGPLIILGLSFFGLLYSIYLSYLELFVIHAICPFCALSALILLAMFIISVLRFQKTMETV